MNGQAEDPIIKNCTSLVVVCCHATYLGDGSSTAEDQWILQDFQRSDATTQKPSEHRTFITHIHAAAMIVSNNPKALLIFSGGRTASATRTEAEGYSSIFSRLLSKNTLHSPILTRPELRYFLEIHATDSYQNLLFSIVRFRKLTGSYPQDITVVTHAFKERRFLEQHAPAIRWPAARIRVQGINPPFTKDELDTTIQGERERAQALFALDPYGVRAPLSDKRTKRNWDPLWANTLLGEDLESEVRELLEWTGGADGRNFFPLKLPWEK